MLLFLVLVLILISLVLCLSQVSPGDLRLRKTLSNKAENVKNNHYSPPHVTVPRLKMSAAAS